MMGERRCDNVTIAAYGLWVRGIFRYTISVEHWGDQVGSVGIKWDRVEWSGIKYQDRVGSSVINWD